jgi:hypothetical protein
MYVYIINFVKLRHRCVLMCCSDSMNNILSEQHISIMLNTFFVGRTIFKII